MESTAQKLDYSKLVSFIWSIADSCLRDIYTRGKYRDVIIPMTVIRRFDLVNEKNFDQIQQKIEEITTKLRKNPKYQDVTGGGYLLEKEVDRKLDIFVRRELNTSFFNKSSIKLSDLRSYHNPQDLGAKFREYIDNFSENVKDILNKFNFDTQITKMVETEILYSVIDKFTSSDFNLSPFDTKDSEGNTLKGLDNHAMGTLFEELLRKFNEENNEEAGEHFTPRDVVELMADLAVLPILDGLDDGTISIYDGACGTLGMGTVAEEKIATHAISKGKEISIHLSGQEVNAETYAIARADLLLKGKDEKANTVFHGSTISTDAYKDERFDLMLSNPPYGKDWSNDFKQISKILDDKAYVDDKRFVFDYKGETLNLVPSTKDGQILFLLNNIAKMKREAKNGSRIIEVHSSSPLYNGDAGSGLSETRRYVIEEDLLEAIIQLPTQMFYNTEIVTYLWVLSCKKEERRKNKIQLIDAKNICTPLRAGLGNKQKEFSKADREFIYKLYDDFTNNEYSKVVENVDFGYIQVNIERPLREAIDCSSKKLEAIKAKLTEVGFFSGKLDKDALKEKGLKATKGSLKVLEDTPRLNFYLELLASFVSKERYLDYQGFIKNFDAQAKALVKEKGLALTKVSFNELIGTGLVADLIVKDERAEIQKDNKGKIKPDPELRIMENIPLRYRDNLDLYLDENVRPYIADVFIDESKLLVGYDISFNRHFAQSKPLKTTKQIFAEIEEINARAQALFLRLKEEFNA